MTLGHPWAAHVQDLHTRGRCFLHEKGEDLTPTCREVGVLLNHWPDRQSLSSFPGGLRGACGIAIELVSGFRTLCPIPVNVLGRRAGRQGHLLPLRASPWSSCCLQLLWEHPYTIRFTLPCPWDLAQGCSVHQFSLKCEWLLRAALNF